MLRRILEDHEQERISKPLFLEEVRRVADFAALRSAIQSLASTSGNARLQHELKRENERDGASHSDGGDAHAPNTFAARAQIARTHQGQGHHTRPSGTTIE